MQQRVSNITMEGEDGKQLSFKNRQNSKAKFLVRSHAMRESTSPPREPSPNHLVSPCIKLTPSPEYSASPECCSPCPKPLVVLSPSLSRGGSPNRVSPNSASPTSTLVPSPNSRCSSQSASSHFDHDRIGNSDGEGPHSPKYLNRLNKNISDQTSHTSIRKKYICECPNQSCGKCAKPQERNINNNLTNINNNMLTTCNTLTVTRSCPRGKLRQQSSSQGSFEGSSSNSPCLSRDNSSEQYTDSTGIDLDIFIPETLNRNAKDRALMLRIEQELVSLAKDRLRTHYKFPPMSSYQRMLVHRCAAYFGMDHNVETSGKCVIVNKSKFTRVPDIDFKSHIKEDIIFSDEPRRSILKRDSNSMEDYGFKSPERGGFGMENRRSKSFEEREEEYERARRRIFNRAGMEELTDDLDWGDTPWSSTESDNSGRFRLLPPDSHRKHFGKLMKVQSEDSGEAHRPCVAKSYSFGGYGGSVLSRGDSVMSTHSAGPRLLTKQDSSASSVSWRLSPSSSGYKSQSQMSESVTPSPTSTPYPETGRQDSGSDGQEYVPDQLVWAVTNIQSIPKGSIIIDPQTGKAIKNQDGTIYHYDPSNPPECIGKPPPSPQKTATPKDSPKKKSLKPPPVESKLSLTNTATSPSLPYSPPAIISPQQAKSFQEFESVTAPQPYSLYKGPLYNGPSQENVPVYPQQPYVLYNPYNCQMAAPYDTRMEAPAIPTETYYVPEGTAPPSQAIAYHQSATNYWNQQPVYYTGSQTPSQRFAVPIAPSQTGYITGYAPNYVHQTPSQVPQGTELVPVFPNQVQMVYQPQPQNQPVYSNQPQMIYTSNPVFPGQVGQVYPHPGPIPQPTIPYPTTPTPNSVTSSNFSDQQQNFLLSQTMQQLNLNAQQQTRNMQQHQKCLRIQGPKFGNPKGFLMGSSQSSTGTNSPAATVISGYCPTGQGLFRTPPDTPSNQFSFAQNFPAPPPIMFRQMSNVRASTPGTARSSRSPTPAGDISQYERQRMSLPPNLYQRMPYVIQPDRIISQRAHPTSYRHSAPLKQQYSFGHGPDNRSQQQNRGNHKKSNNRGKPSGLPPSGRPA